MRCYFVNNLIINVLIANLLISAKWESPKNAVAIDFTF
jgi:hypothetical protein